MYCNGIYVLAFFLFGTGAGSCGGGGGGSASFFLCFFFFFLRESGDPGSCGASPNDHWNDCPGDPDDGSAEPPATPTLSSP